MPKKKYENTFNPLIFLERRLDYLEDKLKSYENIQGPIINTLPVKIYDIVPLEKKSQCYKPFFFLIVLIVREKDKRCPIIKVSREILTDIINSEDVITIYDYLHIENFAEKTLDKYNEWVWKLR